MKVQARTTIEEEITGTITAEDLLKSLRATFKLPAGALVRFFVTTYTSGEADIDDDMPIQFKAVWRTEVKPPEAAPPGIGPGLADTLERSRLRTAIDQSLLRARDQDEPVTPDRDR